MQLTGSEIIIECLKEQGVDTVFGYPGGTILNVYDALYKHSDFVTIWKMLRKKGCVPSALTQNVKDLLASRQIENIFENSDFMVLLSQAQGDRQILAKQLGISPHQLSYVTHSNPGEGLLFFGNVTIPFVDRFPKNTKLYSIMTTRPEEKEAQNE